MGGESRKAASHLLIKCSESVAVCGILVVNRKIAAKLAAIFLKMVDPRRIELPNLSDANRTLSQLSYGPK